MLTISTTKKQIFYGIASFIASIIIFGFGTHSRSGAVELLAPLLAFPILCFSAYQICSISRPVKAHERDRKAFIFSIILFIAKFLSVIFVLISCYYTLVIAVMGSIVLAIR